VLQDEILEALFGFSFVVVISDQQSSLCAPLRTGQQELMIHPRLASDVRKLPRRIVNAARDLSNLVPTMWDHTSIVDPTRVITIVCAPYSGMRSARLPFFLPVVQRTELNRSRNLLM
jgi:hypothetical protein